MINQTQFLNEIKKVALSFDKKAEVILYGSRARGDYKEDSDWDVLMLTENEVDYKKREALIEKIFDVELKHLQAISMLVVDRQTWHNWEIKPLYKNVTREGIAI